MHGGFECRAVNTPPRCLAVARSSSLESQHPDELPNLNSSEWLRHNVGQHVRGSTVAQDNLTRSGSVFDVVELGIDMFRSSILPLQREKVQAALVVLEDGCWCLLLLTKVCFRGSEFQSMIYGSDEVAHYSFQLGPIRLRRILDLAAQDTHARCDVWSGISRHVEQRSDQAVVLGVVRQDLRLLGILVVTRLDRTVWRSYG